MKRILSGISAALLSITMAAPVAAAPLNLQKAPVASDLLVQVQGRDKRFGWRVGKRYEHRGKRGYREGRWEYRGNNPYYRGHRGYRSYRPGYREFDGAWFPAAAFIAGALITGAINSGGGRLSSAHVQWCNDRYRSYRASDDTFQPYNGPRQRCNSPYN